MGAHHMSARKPWWQYKTVFLHTLHRQNECALSNVQYVLNFIRKTWIDDSPSIYEVTSAGCHHKKHDVESTEKRGRGKRNHSEESFAVELQFVCIREKYCYKEVPISNHAIPWCSLHSMVSDLDVDKNQQKQVSPPTWKRKRRTDRSVSCPLLVLSEGGGTPVPAEGIPSPIWVGRG